MKSLKNMPESLEAMTDSDQLRPLFWSLWRCFDLFVDKHKSAFPLVEKCRVTSWPFKFRDIPDCCSGHLAAYQDLSMRHDWPVEEAIVDLPTKLKGKSAHLR